MNFHLSFFSVIDILSCIDFKGNKNVIIYDRFKCKCVEHAYSISSIYHVAFLLENINEYTKLSNELNEIPSASGDDVHPKTW